MRARLLPLLAAAALAAGCNRGAPTSGGSSPPKPAVSTSIRFTDVAAVTGLDYRYSPGAEPPLNIMEVTCGAGAAFLDYDGDGWLDILCVSYPRPALYHGEQGKRFSDVTDAAGLPRRQARWNGCATGDIDNDGDVDLVLTAYDGATLLRNNGNGTFTDVTEAAGIRLKKWCTSAGFADVNRDGLLDLYVGGYVDFRPGMPEWMTVRGVKLPLSPLTYHAQKGALFLNLGGGRFRDATREAGLEKAHGKTLGTAFADADGDGDDDLYLANDEEAQDFFENDGKGRFRDAALENGTAWNAEGGRQGGMGLDFGDYDGDGDLDLFVGTFSDEMKSLYRAGTGGLYEHAAVPAGLAQATRRWVTFGARFFDADCDGSLDLMIVNGHVHDQIAKVDAANSFPQPSQLFRNEGEGRFREITDAVGPDFRKKIVGRALAIGDFDNDGDLDALAADLVGPPLLLRNDSPPASWLELQLAGKRSNRMAIGARVELVAGGKTQLRELRTDASFLSAHDPRVHFGLGQATAAEEIRIRWPSGTRQVLKNVPARQAVKVTEGG